MQYLSFFVISFFLLFSDLCFSGESYYSYGAGKERIDGAGTIHYYVDDQVDSARAILKEDQSVEWTSDYQPFGKEVNVQANGGAEDKTFSGKEHDATELYYFGARYYDPGTGRFYSVDPEGQDASSYTYTGNNPLVRVDPTGGRWEDVWMGIQRDGWQGFQENLSQAASDTRRIFADVTVLLSFVDLLPTSDLVNTWGSEGSVRGKIFWSGVAFVPFISNTAIKQGGGIVAGIKINQLIGMIDIFLDNPQYKHHTLTEFAEFLGVNFKALQKGFNRNAGLQESWEKARVTRGLTPRADSRVIRTKTPDFLEVIDEYGNKYSHNMILFLNNLYGEIGRVPGVQHAPRSPEAQKAVKAIRAKYEARRQKMGIPYDLRTLEKMFRRDRVATGIRKYRDIVPEEQMYTPPRFKK